MDNLAQVTPDKFQKNDNVIAIQDHQQQMTSRENHSVSKHEIHFVQKFLTKHGIGNTPNNEKLPNNQIVIYIKNPSPIFYPEGYEMQKLQTPFQGNSSNFLNICDSPDFMDKLADEIRADKK